MNSPNFFCLGAPKSGTTTLYDVLKKHSDIFLSSFKEPHFFDINDNWEQGVDWYKKNYFSKSNNETMIGDFTPTYLSLPYVAKRIKNSIDGPLKFIIILRNPTDRAYSHYLHSKRDGYENLKFLKALKKEKSRLIEANSQNDTLKLLKFGYVSQGLYAEQLKVYFKYFERSQFHIVLFEDFILNQEAVSNEILKFLGLNTSLELDFNIQSNKASEAKFPFIKRLLKENSIIQKIARFVVPSFIIRQKLRNMIHRLNNKELNKDKISKEDLKTIYETYFKDDIIELEKILDKDLSTWKYD
jgi:hypothetical protein